MVAARIFLIILLCAGCSHHAEFPESMVAIQVQDRNGLTETISNPEKLDNFRHVDFLAEQPYKKILRIYRNLGRTYSKLTTYHPNGGVWQYLEAEELRAHGAYREWHPNGQLKIEATVIGGTADVSQGAQKDWLFDGISRVFDDQGRLLAKIPYAQGVLEGLSVAYFPTGGVERESPYHNHLLEGEVVEYDMEGGVRSKTSYSRGEKQGRSYGYFRNRQLAWEELYAGGLLISGAYYSARGELLSQVEEGSGFRALFDGEMLVYMVQIQQGFGEGGVKQFSSKGDLYATYYVKNGKKTGTETIFFEGKEPHPKLSMDWEDGKIHGTVKTWYQAGQLQSQRDFCHNKKMGPSLAWYRDGSLMFVEEYEEDHLVKGQYYRKNGLDAISAVVHGSGVATLYDENGVFLRKISYVKGEAVDPE